MKDKKLNALYLLSAGIVALLLVALRPSAAFVGTYYCVTFWLVLLVDAFVSSHKGFANSSKWSAADRFIAYLFVAPFIWPARLYALVSRQR